MAESGPSAYFRVFFSTVRRNEANDMALESLKKCETSICRLFFPILYGFKSISKMAENVFLA